MRLRTLFLLIFMLLTAPVWAAAPHYVNPNNAAGPWDGHSHATGFRTLDQVNAHTFATGDDLYFLCGGVWTSYAATHLLGIDWSGNSGDTVYVGAYHLVGSTETVGVPTGGQKPIINGNFIAAPNHVSGQPYHGLIEFPSRSYVTVQDLDIRNSDYIGIYAEGASNFTIQRCTIYNSRSSGISLGGGANTGTVDNNYAYECGVRNIGVSTAAGMAATQVAHDITFSNNTITRCTGEAIGAYYGCYNITINNNTCYNNGNIAIYLSGYPTNCVVKSNLVYHTTTGSYLNWGGIAVGDETRMTSGTATSGISIFNNVVVGMDYGIYLITHETGAWSDLSDILVYNNTLIDNNQNFRISGPVAKYTSGNLIKNNISWLLTAGKYHVVIPSGTTIAGMDWSNNLWYGNTLPTGEASGTGDITSGAPGLVKTSGFLTLTDGGLTWDDVKYSSISGRGIDKGADTSALVTTDYWGTSRPQNAWGGAVVDIGVHEWPAPVTPTCGDALGCVSPKVCADDNTEPWGTPYHCNTDCGACPGESPALKIQWKLDTDSAETEQDETANNLDLTLSGTTRVTGFIDSYARSFNGSSDYAYRDAIPGLKAKFSLCGWFQVSESGRNQALFGTGSTNNYRLRLSTDNKVVFSTTAVSIVNSFSTSVGLNEWHHVCGTYDGTNQKLYLDGALVDTDAASVPAADSIINVGRTIWGEYLKGKLDDIRIYDGAIDAAAVLALYEAGAEPETDETAPTVTEYQVPSVPLAGIPVYKFVTTEAGTISLVGPCKTATTTATAGINEINFSVMGKGTYSDCTLTVTDASSNATTLNISPFTVDYWTLSGFGSGGVTITPSATGAMTLYFGGALPE